MNLDREREIRQTLRELLEILDTQAENESLRTRMSDLLTRTANALRGNPEPQHLHSWADLPERAADMRHSLNALIGHIKAWHDLLHQEGYGLDNELLAEMRAVVVPLGEITPADIQWAKERLHE